MNFEAWDDVKPPNRTSSFRSSGVTARAILRANGGTSIQCYFSPEWCERYGHHPSAKAKASPGDDEGGLLRLWFGGGPLKVYRSGRYPRRQSMRLTLDAPTWFAPGARALFKIEVEQSFEDGVLLRLPISRPAMALGRGAAPTAAASVAPAADIAPVDVTFELRGRHVKALAARRWQVDGDIYTAEAVAILINKIRKRANLPPITAAQIADGAIAGAKAVA